MKIQYLGHKERGLNVILPVGAMKRDQKGLLCFHPGETLEVEDLDGEKLLALDKAGHFKQVVDQEVKVEDAPEAEPVSDAEPDKEEPEKKSKKAKRSRS